MGYDYKMAYSTNKFTHESYYLYERFWYKHLPKCVVIVNKPAKFGKWVRDQFQKLT